MIILHCATAEETKQKVYGYALREDGKVFIVREDGVKVPVRAETVMPYQACHRLEDYISLTKRTLEAFHEKKIYYLEDIEDKGRSVLKSIRGVGPARQRAILEIMNDVLNEYYPPWEPPVSRFRATRKFLP